MARHQQENMWSDLRVGIVIFVGMLLLFLGIVFAGGDKGLLFRKKAYLMAELSNVGGLKRGSSVTMNGMTIGQVTEIGFSSSPQKNGSIEVTMQIRSDIRSRIKADSVPSVRTQGMLGDRYVDISAGGSEAPMLPEGKSLAGEGASDFDQTFREALRVLQETEKLLHAMNGQEGTMGKFFYDERFYDNLIRITDELNSFLQDFQKRPRKYIKFSIF